MLHFSDSWHEYKWDYFLQSLYQSEHEQIKDMLNKAFERFPSVQGLIMHSDQGWQYQHAFYRSELQSMELYNLCPESNCYDNCIMETFFGRSWKIEMFYGLEKDYPPLNPSLRRLLSISTITITPESKLKQNGCLPLSSGKHHDGSLIIQFWPGVRKLGTYQASPVCSFLKRKI